jgi:hypothetical protein
VKEATNATGLRVVTGSGYVWQGRRVRVLSLFDTNTEGIRANVFEPSPKTPHDSRRTVPIDELEKRPRCQRARR